MKCQKCGINEVNFHYTSNVNGAITEARMCSSCATESGYNFDKMFGFGLAGFMPMAVSLPALNAMFPFTIRPQVGMIDVKVDEEINLRRELSAQMRAAVEKEEFEKAAELRDKIKELEAGRTVKCDSETTSQDLPSAQ